MPCLDFVLIVQVSQKKTKKSEEKKMDKKWSDGEKGPSFEEVLFWFAAFAIAGIVIWLSLSPSTFPKEVLEFLKSPWFGLVVGLVSLAVGFIRLGTPGIILMAFGGGLATISAMDIIRLLVLP